ncbi:MAG: site-specific DNA-methyltransferase [Candidatus Eremiobacteraeota bacterium]|nr:site-specific DNA-methyltransferase [Candidatus Eremiobacteraeota bacterium]
MENNYEVLEFSFTDESVKICLDKDKLADTIDYIISRANLNDIRDEVQKLLSTIREDPLNNPWTADTSILTNGKCYRIDPEVFIGNLQQIFDTFSLDRTRYYLKRLKKSTLKIKTGKVNDINLNRWKEYNHVNTDSLWIEKKRSRAGNHMASYWGNFIPQIPQQMMLRFTKQREYVLDTFSGSGTTMIECRRLGRNGVGIELNPEAAKNSRFVVESQENPFDVKTDVIEANSATIDYKKVLDERGIKKVQLIVMHPPYYDIIKFSENGEDLSNAASVDDFLDRMDMIVRNSAPALENGRYMCLVIGDKYTGGEWIPLGFYAMQRILSSGFYKLKSIVVKNFQETKGKRNQKELWRYRALVGGFYLFKHEYIFLFQKE